jgi:predicted ATPase
MASAVDHRTTAALGSGKFMYPLGPATTERAKGQLAHLLAAKAPHGAAHTGAPAAVEAADATADPDAWRGPLVHVPVMMGRTLSVHSPCTGVAVVTFDELCSQPLGAADYLALAQRFRTVFLLGVPALRRTRHNEARRLITLVDVLYEHRADVHITATVPPTQLFTRLLQTSAAGRHGGGPMPREPVAGDPRDREVEGAGTAYADPATVDDLAMDEVALDEDDAEEETTDATSVARHGPTAVGADTLPAGGPPRRGVVSVVTSAAERAAMGELAFACERAVSRLIEMTSAGYGDKPATHMARGRADGAAAATSAGLHRH